MGAGLLCRGLGPFGLAPDQTCIKSPGKEGLGIPPAPTEGPHTHLAHLQSGSEKGRRGPDYGMYLGQRVQLVPDPL